MKRAILGLTVISLLFAASCAKNPTSGGSWTFRGVGYNVTTCNVIGDYIAASSSTNTNNTYFGGVAVSFPGTTFPASSGTYTVVDTIPIGNQVTILATVGGVNDTAYAALGGAGQTVNVTIAGGKVTVSGSNLVMYNANAVPTTDTLSFNIYN
jgi:hypothetical protein